MKKAILATKVGMTQVFDENGLVVPVTVLLAGPCPVLQVKTEENDGYKAVVVGFSDIREKLVSKPLKGTFDKAGVSYKRFIREFRLENAEDYAVKDEIKADIFEAGDVVDATAVSRAKAIRARSSVSDSTEDPWRTVPNSTVIRAPMRLRRPPDAFRREKACPVTWAAIP